MQWFLCLKHPQLSILFYFYDCFCANITLFKKDICIFILIFFDFTLSHVKLPGWNPHPLQWKLRVLTLGLPEKSNTTVLISFIISLSGKDRSFNFFPQDCLDYADPLNFCIKSFRNDLCHFSLTQRDMHKRTLRLWLY